MDEVRNYVRQRREEETTKELDQLISEVESEGYLVEFGNIGQKTTYAMIYTEDHAVEFVGYTFVANLKYFNVNTGKLKALQQAIARQQTLANKQ